MLRAAIVGLDWWGQTLLRLVERSAAIAPVAVCDLDRALIAAFRCAHEAGWRSVSFPAVSAGICAVPLETCARS